jgi:hypothetical protein
LESAELLANWRPGEHGNAELLVNWGCFVAIAVAAAVVVRGNFAGCVDSKLPVNDCELGN